jgi:hypothetical protein
LDEQQGGSGETFDGLLVALRSRAWTSWGWLGDAAPASAGLGVRRGQVAAEALGQSVARRLPHWPSKPCSAVARCPAVAQHHPYVVGVERVHAHDDEQPRQGRHRHDARHVDEYKNGQCHRHRGHEERHPAAWSGRRDARGGRHGPTHAHAREQAGVASLDRPIRSCRHPVRSMRRHASSGMLCAAAYDAAGDRPVLGIEREPPMTTSSTSDAEALRAENEALRSRLQSERIARHARWRRVVAAVLAVLAVLATTLALVTVWSVRTLTNTDLFVARVAPIIEDPAVAQAIGTAAAEELVTALDLEQRLADRLPEPVSVVAGPVATAAQGYLADGITGFVQTEGVQSAWESSLSAGHRITIRILSGSNADAVENVNGVVVLDLTPLINEALAEGTAFVSQLLDRDIDAPELTSDDIDAAVAALQEQLGEDLPVDFGQVVLFESENLALAQQAYQAVRVLGWLAPLAAILLVVLAVVVSTDRVRTGMWIAIGVAGSLLLVAVALQPLKSGILEAAAAQGLNGAIAAGFDTVFSSLRSGLVAVVVLGALAALVLVATGRSRVGQATRDALRRSPSLAAAHPGTFLLGGALVAVGVAALIPGRSWGQLLLVALLYGIYAAAVLLAPPQQQR